MVDRIASFVTTSNINRSTMRLQADFSKLTEQNASGLKSPTYSGIARDTQFLLKLEADFSYHSSAITSLTAVSSRLQSMYDALGSITETVAATIADASAAISGGLMSADELQQSAQLAYDSVVASLNTRFGDRYLFGGSAVSRAPVDVTSGTYPVFTSPSAPNTSYYQGNHESQSVRAANGMVIDYSVHADSAGFEKTLRALNLVINNAGNPAALTEAMGLLQAGNDAIGVLQHGVSLDANMVTKQLDEHTAAKTQLKNTIAELRGTDIAEATVRAKEIETQLTASFSLTATLLSLRIVDYLR